MVVGASLARAAETATDMRENQFRAKLAVFWGAPSMEGELSAHSTLAKLQSDGLFVLVQSRFNEIPVPGVSREHRAVQENERRWWGPWTIDGRR